MTEKKTITLLFVCTGNTCRSSMAEAIARDYLSRRSNSSRRIRIISAGTGAVDNEPASLHAKTVMNELGIDLAGHRARKLTPELVEEADLILVMTERHKEHIERIEEKARGKVYLLKEYVEPDKNLKKLTEEATRIYERIDNKKKNYYKAHQKELEALQQRRRELLTQLKEVEGELLEWENRLAGIITDDAEGLQGIEKQLAERDVLDPFGKPMEYYRVCAEELLLYIRKALDKLLNSG